MNIIINNAKYTPSWELLQTMVRQTMNDETATFTRISRVDGGCNYRAPGEYHVDIRCHSEVVELNLSVVE